MEHRVGKFDVETENGSHTMRSFVGNGDHLIDGTGISPELVIGYSLGQKWFLDILYSAANGYELEVENLEGADFGSHVKFQTFAVRIGYKL